LPAPKLVSPILVLVKNGAIVGYGGAAQGDVPLGIAPPATFALNHKVQVVEYIGSDVALSNTVTVGCHAPVDLG
jgi:hypothetical protein